MNSNIKISFISLGCDKNLVDSEIMLGLIDEGGYIITSDDNKADIIIINSCGFISDAIEETIENILKTADYKREGNCKAIIVTGCMAQRYKKQIFESLPEVDAVVGTGDFESIGEVIKDVLKGKKVEMITDNNKILNEENNLKRMISTVGYFEYIKIAEGCDNHCTYCTIPSIRGKYRSRKIENIIEEAKILAQKGTKEIVLVAQDTSLYGTDIYGEKKLSELIRKLSEIEDIEWIRILYCYPENIDDSLIEEIASNPKVCHYLDMPIQHCSDNILKLMGRKSTKEKITTTIKKLREKITDICLRTTLIVGFPNESNEEFEELKNFIKEIKFDKLGVFSYSREEDTPAYKLPNQISEELKIKRKDEIMKLQENISFEKGKTFIGKTLKVIVEGKISDENVYCGRSYRDCYEIDGFVFFEYNKELISGDFVNVKINKSTNYDLIGVVENEPSK